MATILQDFYLFRREFQLGTRDHLYLTIKIHQERYIEQMAESLKGEIKKEGMPHGSSKEPTRGV